ncbi:MAG: putative toxin-antitoxin system toxin component, PIN family [Candidatus Humimicrobiaceae bacterium]
MRVMVDTNVIISSILKEGSLPDIVLNDVCENHELILCDYIISESYDIAKRHFPLKILVLDKLFAKLRYELVPAPKLCEIKVRDVKDQPILNAAIDNSVDILVTGDKHFLELDIEIPQIYTPAEYRNLYIEKI